jgi:diketogulonate reductase-like aldo/keto reductase
MNDMPMMGLGTFIGIEADRIASPQLRHQTTVNTLLSALRMGYRHLDLAEAYDNLPAVAEALRIALQSVDEGGLGLTRDKFWLTMKANAPFDDAHIDHLLATVGVTYFDLFLIHHPTECGIFEDESALTQAWSELADVDFEKLHRIGVSNAYVPHLARLLALCEREHLDTPYANEVEVNLLFKNQEVTTYCQDHGIHVIAHSPLGYHCTPLLLENKTLKQLATAIESTPAQAALAWSMANGMTVIPKSTHDAHLAENFASQDYVHEMQFHSDLTQALVLAPDTFPEGVTATSEAMKAHAENLTWDVGYQGAVFRK